MKRFIFLAALFGTQVRAIPSPDFSSAPPAPAGLKASGLHDLAHMRKFWGGGLLHPVWRMLRVPMY
jgi:hypothetical protein